MWCCISLLLNPHFWYGIPDTMIDCIAHDRVEHFSSLASSCNVFVSFLFVFLCCYVWRTNQEKCFDHAMHAFLIPVPLFFLFLRDDPFVTIDRQPNQSKIQSNPIQNPIQSKIQSKTIKKKEREVSLLVLCVPVDLSIAAKPNQRTNYFAQ